MLRRDGNYLSRVVSAENSKITDAIDYRLTLKKQALEPMVWEVVALSMKNS